MSFVCFFSKKKKRTRLEQKNHPPSLVKRTGFERECLRGASGFPPHEARGEHDNERAQPALSLALPPQLRRERDVAAAAALGAVAALVRERGELGRGRGFVAQRMAHGEAAEPQPLAGALERGAAAPPHRVERAATGHITEWILELERRRRAADRRGRRQARRCARGLAARGHARERGRWRGGVVVGAAARPRAGESRARVVSVLRRRRRSSAREATGKGEESARGATVVVVVVVVAAARTRPSSARLDGAVHSCSQLFTGDILTTRSPRRGRRHARQRDTHAACAAREQRRARRLVRGELRAERVGRGREVRRGLRRVCVLFLARCHRWVEAVLILMTPRRRHASRSLASSRFALLRATCAAAWAAAAACAAPSSAAAAAAASSEVPLAA